MSPAFKLYSKENDYIEAKPIPKQVVKDGEDNVPIKVTKSIKVYFTTKKGKATHELMSSFLLPSHLALLNIKDFNKIYYEQLEKVLVLENLGSNLSPLIELLALYRDINKGNYPIRIVTSNHKKLLPKICYVLNMLFNKYYLTIECMYGCFNSHVDTEAEKPISKDLKNPSLNEERPLEPLKDDDLIIE